MEAHSDESIVLQRLSEDLTHPKDDIQHVSFMRLPPEILCEIASHGLAMETGPKPWILNQVCTFVRETINSTKTLWSTICITRKGYYATKDDLNQVPCGNAKYLQLVLERATPVPLAIILRHHLDPSMASILASHSTHISRVRLYDRDRREIKIYKTIQEDWDPFFGLKLTNLRDLEIVSGDNSPNSYAHAFLNMALQSEQPHLTLALPKSKISDLLILLRHGLSQRISALDIFLDDESRVHTPGNYAMPQLEYLTLHGNFGLIAPFVPRLRYLAVCSVGRPGKLQPHDLPDSLEELLIEKADMLEYDGSIGLRPLINLTCLTLVEVDIHDGFCPHFSLPNLQELTLSRVSLVFEKYTEDRPLLSQDIFGYLPALRRLWLDKLYQSITDDFSFCPNLVALRISSSGFLCDPLDSLSMDSTAVTRLEEVFIGWIQDINFVIGDFLRACALNRPSLMIYTENDFDRLQYPFREGLCM